MIYYVCKLDILIVPPGMSWQGSGGEVSRISGEEMETAYTDRVCK